MSLTSATAPASSKEDQSEKVECLSIFLTVLI